MTESRRLSFVTPRVTSNGAGCRRAANADTGRDTTVSACHRRGERIDASAIRPES